MSAKLSVTLLGDTELASPAGRVRLSGKKQIALLAYLCVTTPKFHSRDKLATLLWGDHPEANARQSLRQALTEIRSALPKGVVISAGGTLSVSADLTICDVAEFERLARDGAGASLARAADLYRGPLLDGLILEVQEWAEWLDVERQRLQDLALEVLIRHASNLLEGGQCGEAIATARRAIAIDAFREDAHRIAIAAAAASGSRAQALRFYEQLRDLLHKELDIEPDETVTQLIEEIQQSGQRGEGGIPVEAGRAILAVESTTASGSNAAELGGLQAAVRGAASGYGRLVERQGNVFLFDFPDGRTAVSVGQAIRDADRRMGIHTSVSRTEAKTAAAVLAARLAPGELAVTGEVCDTIVDGVDATVADIGEYPLLSSGRSARLYRLTPAENILHLPPTTGRILPTVTVLSFEAEQSSRVARVSGEYLADEIYHAICRSHELSVTSRLSARGLLGSGDRMSEAKKFLGADYLLWGACKLRGSELDLDIELADVGSGRAIWRDTLSTPAEKIALGQTELVEKVLSLIKSAILTHELERSQIEPLETLENYTLLAAAIGMIHRTSPACLDRGREFLDLLLHRLPHHPLPPAWRAQLHLFRITLGMSPDPVEEERLALDEAARAIELNPMCSIALATEAWVHLHLRKRFDIAAERLDLALQSNPSDATAWLLKGTMHAFRDEGQNAVSATQQALRLSPLDPRRSYFDALAAAAHLSNGEPEIAIEYASRSLRLNRYHASTLRALIVAYVLAGRDEEARRLVPDLIKLQPGLTVSMYLASHPAAEYKTGQVWADALRRAGVPK